MSNGNYRGDGTGQGYELDILEIAFLVFCGLFALFYFTNGNFKYCVNSFYIFISYSFKVYPVIIIAHPSAPRNSFSFSAGISDEDIRVRVL